MNEIVPVIQLHVCTILLERNMLEYLKQSGKINSTIRLD